MSPQRLNRHPRRQPTYPLPHQNPGAFSPAEEMRNTSFQTVMYTSSILHEKSYREQFTRRKENRQKQVKEQKNIRAANVILTLCLYRNFSSLILFDLFSLAAKQETCMREEKNKVAPAGFFTYNSAQPPRQTNNTTTHHKTTKYEHNVKERPTDQKTVSFTPSCMLLPTGDSNFMRQTRRNHSPPFVRDEKQISNAENK